MTRPTNLGSLNERSVPHIELLREFFVQQGAPCGSPEDIAPLAERLSSAGPFHDKTVSMLRDVIRHDDAIASPLQLLDLLCVVVGGPEAGRTDADIHGPVGKLLVFVNIVFLSLRKRPFSEASAQTALPRTEETNAFLAPDASQAAAHTAQSPTDPGHASNHSDEGEHAPAPTLPDEDLRFVAPDLTSAVETQPRTDDFPYPSATDVAAGEGSGANRFLEDGRFDLPMRETVTSTSPVTREISEAPEVSEASIDFREPAEHRGTAEPREHARAAAFHTALSEAEPVPRAAPKRSLLSRPALLAAGAVLLVLGSMALLSRKPPPRPVTQSPPSALYPGSASIAKPSPYTGPANVQSQAAPGATEASGSSTNGVAADDGRAAAQVAGTQQQAGGGASSIPDPPMPGDSPESQSPAPEGVVSEGKDQPTPTIPDVSPDRPTRVHDALTLRHGSRGGLFAVSSGVMSANLISAPPPDYPLLARITHVEGQVILQAVVSRKGQVVATHVLQGHHLLRGAAEGAVQRWRYRPYQMNGKSTDVETIVFVNFRLHH